MKKIVVMAAFLASGFSMVSCTAEALEDSVPTNQVTVSADGEPVTTPVVVPPPPPPVAPIKGIN